MKKYKINLMENIPDDKEITSYMNFNKVVSKYKFALLWKKLLIGSISTGGVALTVATAIYFSGNNQQDSEVTPLENENSNPLTEMITSEPLPDDINSNNNLPGSTKSAIPEAAKPLSEKRESKEETENRETPKRIEVTEEGQSYNYIFKKASPVIGYDSLYRYLQEGMILPEASDNLKGRVVVAFSIDTLGRPENIKIVEGLTDEINNEAIRLVGSMPEWSPAELNGKPVETSLSIPIYIEIVKSEIQK